MITSLASRDPAMFGRLKTLFEKKAPAEFRHAYLGLLSCESGLWSGRVQQHGRDIPFVVAGTEAAPDPHLLNRLLDLLTKLHDLEKNALQFLCPPTAPVKPSDFIFQSVDVLWPAKPNRFVLEFALECDADAIWRVEFEDEQPKYSGRDD